MLIQRSPWLILTAKTINSGHYLIHLCVVCAMVPPLFSALNKLMTIVHNNYACTRQKSVHKHSMWKHSSSIRLPLREVLKIFTNEVIKKYVAYSFLCADPVRW